jgi:hypothetical protein
LVHADRHSPTPSISITVAVRGGVVHAQANGFSSRALSPVFD